MVLSALFKWKVHLSMCVASQQGGRGFDAQSLEPFCSLKVCVGSLRFASFLPQSRKMCTPGEGNANFSTLNGL